ncbi:hypothetical protein SAFG77S_12227 [Streptomyces afghaniensis]
MASVLGMLEERGPAARVRVEGLREEVARLAEVGGRRDRAGPAGDRAGRAGRGPRAASAAETTAGTEAEEKAVLSLAPVPGSTGRPGGKGCR